MILYFLRHGLAGSSTEWQGEDRIRPLTAKGMKRSEEIAKFLLKQGVKPARIITSPLSRARETAEITAAEMDCPVEEDERLSPGFSTLELAAIVNENSDVQELMIVGHEPDFSETIGAVIGGGDVVMKKGGIARVDIPDPASMEGQLVWLLPPKMMV